MTIYKYGELMDELRNRLSSLGLSSYEAIAYLVLLKNGTLTAGELVKKSGIPHSRIYDVSRRLSEKGLIEIIDEKPRKFKPIDPDIALRAYVEKEKNRLKKTCDDILNLLSFLTLSVKLEYKTTWVVETEFIEIIAPLIRKAQNQLLLASNPPVIKQVREELIQASSRGVNITVICYGDIEPDYFIKNGIELYTRKASSLNIVLIDAITGVISDPNVSYSILTTEPIFVRALMDLFYSSLVNTSNLIGKPSTLKGRFVSIWSIIHRLQGGEKLRVKGVRVDSGEEVVIEGIVKDKIIDDGIASIVLQTETGLVRIGGIGAMLEDIEGLIFEIIP